MVGLIQATRIQRNDSCSRVCGLHGMHEAGTPFFESVDFPDLSLNVLSDRVFHSPPQRAATVQNHNYWCIIDVSSSPCKSPLEIEQNRSWVATACLVNMHRFIENIDISVADHLTSPVSKQNTRCSPARSAAGGNDSMGRIGNNVRARGMRMRKSKWKAKKSWKELPMEEKCNVGFIEYQLGIIYVHCCLGWNWMTLVFLESMYTRTQERPPLRPTAPTGSIHSGPSRKTKCH